MKKELQFFLHINIVQMNNVWKEWIHNHLQSKARSLKKCKANSQQLQNSSKLIMKGKCFVKQTSMFLHVFEIVK